jgi:hypothetical protein
MAAVYTGLRWRHCNHYKIESPIESAALNEDVLSGYMNTFNEDSLPLRFDLTDSLYAGSSLIRYDMVIVTSNRDPFLLLRRYLGNV